MLILSRKIGESVVIGNDIYCTVLGIRDGQIRLGFDAPETMPINRDEIHRRLMKEKEEPGAESYPNNAPVVERLVAQFKVAQSSALNTH